MYKEHRSFTKPSNSDAMIWRYMNFAKFVSLLDKNALFFCQLSNLDDPYEAAIPIVDETDFRRFAELEAIHPTYPDLKPDPRQDRLLEDIKKTNAYAAISTWFTSNYESDAMWKLYTSPSEGIAIQTTFELLSRTFDTVTRPVFLGLVKYIDYHNDRIFGTDDYPILNAFMYVIHKRKSFEHEHELRAVVMLPPYGADKADGEELISGKGIYIPVNNATLIQSIYVSPTSPTWLVELVRSLLAKYGLDIPVRQSMLYTIPTSE